MIRRLLAIILAVVAAASTCAAAGPLLILVDKANPPFMYGTTDNNAAGIYPALLAEAFSRMNQPVLIEPMPWKRVLDSIDHGEAGAGGIYRTEERLRKYDYSAPLYEEVILVVESADHPFPFEGLKSFAGKRIGALRGWSYGDAFDKARADGLFEVEDVDGDTQNFLKLHAGRLDAVIAVREAADAAISAMGTPLTFVVQAKPLTANSACLAFSKKSNRSDLLVEFDKTLAAMRQDGTWDKIVKSILAKP